MICLYRVLVGFDIVRQPFVSIPQSMIEKETGDPSTNDGTPKDRAEAAVYEDRLSKLSERLTEYQAAYIEATVVFDQDLSDIDGRIRKLFARVSTAVELRFESLLREFPLNDLTPEQRKEMREDLYNTTTPKKPDSFRVELDSIISDCKKRLT